MKKIFISLFVVLIVLSILAGCSSPAATTTSSVSPTSTTQTTAPTGTTQSKYGGTLKIVTGMSPITLGDPGSTLKPDQILRCPAVERLAEFDATAQLAPSLAESWQSDSQAKTFTVKLKQGINFQDDTPFNAEAVKWVWEYLASVKNPDLDGVTSIDVLDEYTVQVTLAKWDNSIVYKLTYDGGGMVSPTAWEANGAEWGKMNPVGTGAFKLVESISGVGVTYTRWDGYWQEGKPYLDGIEFMCINDQTTGFTTFQSGEADVDINITALQASTIATSDEYVLTVLKKGLGTGEFFICPGYLSDDSPWAKTEVRQALCYAIDTNAIIDNLLYGYGSFTNQWSAPANWAYNQNMEGLPYNPDKARELLDQAGYSEGFTTTFYVDPAGQTFAEFAQSQLAAVGITANIQNIDAPGMFQLKTQTHWEGLITSVANPDGDVSMRLRWNVRSDSPDLVSMYRSAEIDAAVDAALAAPDFASKQALTWELQALVFEELAVFLPIYVGDGLCVAYPYVHDHGFCVNNGDYFTPADAWMDQ
jgi:peptide/nickel transport system substrate-binding protein